MKIVQTWISNETKIYTELENKKESEVALFYFTLNQTYYIYTLKIRREKQIWGKYKSMNIRQGKWQKN